MRLSRINEAIDFRPGYVHIADPSSEFQTNSTAYFNPETATAYQSPKFQGKLSQQLSSLSRWDFLVIVGDIRSKKFLWLFGDNDGPADHKRIAGAYKIPLSAVKNSITVVLNRDGGQPAMSPWLLLHRVFETVSYDQFWNELYKKYRLEILGSSDDAFHSLFKMRSARTKYQGVDSDAELMTEFVWHRGKIRINYPEQIDKETVDRLKAELEQLCAARLDAMVGNIYYSAPPEMYPQKPPPGGGELKDYR